ncbi:MAG: hypothetical protein ACI92O_000348 [Colwellia sp.]|jgi:hypothetical protein
MSECIIENKVLTRREEVHQHLDELFEKNKKFTIRSIQESLPHIRSISSITKFIEEWKIINKEAYDFRNKPFVISNSLQRQLEKEVSLFVSEQHQIVNNSLLESKKELDVALKEIQHLKLKNTQLINDLAKTQEEFRTLNSKTLINENNYHQEIESQKKINQSHSLKLTEQLEKHEVINKGLDHELKLQLQICARLEVKLEQRNAVLEENKRSIEKLTVSNESHKESIIVKTNEIAIINEKLSAEVKLRQSMEQNLKISPADETLIDAYNDLKNEFDKIKTKDLKQTTTIEEQAKLIRKLHDNNELDT